MAPRLRNPLASPHPHPQTETDPGPRTYLAHAHTQGANWSSFAANPAEQRRDTITFEKFAELAHTHPEIVQRRKFCYIWDEDAGYSKPWYRELVGEVRLC
jgi:hypothetical protein